MDDVLRIAREARSQVEAARHGLDEVAVAPGGARAHAAVRRLRAELQPPTDARREPLDARRADAPQDLADDMHAAWIAFATTADPGWPAYNETRPVRVFDAGGGSIEADPRGDERSIWPAG